MLSCFKHQMRIYLGFSVPLHSGNCLNKIYRFGSIFLFTSMRVTILFRSCSSQIHMPLLIYFLGKLHLAQFINISVDVSLPIL